MPDPIRPADAAARATARDLLTQARSAALGVTRPDGQPFVSRIAFGLAPDGAPLSLVSTLSQHSVALAANPACALLVGEPGPRGYPLTHPRLTVVARARLIANGSQDYARLAAPYLRHQPKAKLYIGFADFSFVLFDVTEGHLNAGFGKAHRLTPGDMDLPG